MDEEIGAAVKDLDLTFTPAVSQGVIELSCTARKRVGKLYVLRTLTVRRNFKVTDLLSSCAGYSKPPPMIHINPIEFYRNAVTTRVAATGTGRKDR